MAHDYLFSEKRDEIRDFDFGKDTAVVFDDMLDRSVPFYSEVQRMIGKSPWTTLWKGPSFTILAARPATRL